MNVLIILIPVTMLLALLALGMFLWAIRSGQFDDLDTPAYRLLLDDGEQAAPAESAPVAPAPPAPRG